MMAFVAVKQETKTTYQHILLTVDLRHVCSHVRIVLRSQMGSDGSSEDLSVGWGSTWMDGMGLHQRWTSIPLCKHLSSCPNSLPVPIYTPDLSEMRHCKIEWHPQDQSTTTPPGLSMDQPPTDYVSWYIKLKQSKGAILFRFLTKGNRPSHHFYIHHSVLQIL